MRERPDPGCAGSGPVRCRIGARQAARPWMPVRPVPPPAIKPGGLVPPGRRSGPGRRGEPGVGRAGASGDGRGDVGCHVGTAPGSCRAGHPARHTRSDLVGSAIAPSARTGTARWNVSALPRARRRDRRLQYPARPRSPSVNHSLTCWRTVEEARPPGRRRGHGLPRWHEPGPRSWWPLVNKRLTGGLRRTAPVLPEAPRPEPHLRSATRPRSPLVNHSLTCWRTVKEARPSGLCRGHGLPRSPGPRPRSCRPMVKDRLIGGPRGTAPTLPDAASLALRTLRCPRPRLRFVNHSLTCSRMVEEARRPGSWRGHGLPRLHGPRPTFSLVKVNKALTDQGSSPRGAARLQAWWSAAGCTSPAPGPGRCFARSDRARRSPGAAQPFTTDAARPYAARPC